MKTTSIKSIYLEEQELKQAIVEYVEKTDPALAQHLYDNCCSMNWGWNQRDYVLNKFVIIIDGQTDEKDYSVDIKKSADKVINSHNKAFEKLAENKE